MGGAGRSENRNRGRYTARHFDRDGRADIFVANDSMPEFLFHQKADGTFEEVGLESETAVNAEGQPFAGMGRKRRLGAIEVLGELRGSGEQRDSAASSAP